MANVAIQRQIKLPTSKAVEIAWKSIRLRLARSLVVTSSIALAIAFLLSILAGEAIVDALRDWKTGFETSPRFAALIEQRKTAEEKVAAAEAALRAALRSDSKEKPAAARTVDLTALKEELGALPAGAGEMAAGLASSVAVGGAFDAWLSSARELKKVRDELASPEVLAGRMRAAGVATTPKEIQESRTQTRWVIGLALLVAFVGILNAMLMSVTERFREIGTMKCLGALDGFIVKLFLLESLFQGGAGTLAGVVIGIILSLVAAGSSFGAFAWANLPWLQLLIATGICFAVGVVLTVGGALYPAWQAARMQPIAAMRVEV